MTAHRTLEGSWEECTSMDCALKFHFPGMTVAQMQAMPMAALLPLLEAFDPPSYADPGDKAWLDAEGLYHRDYDLPAEIRGGDFACLGWHQHGTLHRANGRPAIVRPDGEEEWYVQGERHRDYPLPARVNPSIGTTEYWYDGKFAHAALSWSDERWWQR